MISSALLLIILSLLDLCNAFVHFKARNGYIWSFSSLELGHGSGVVIWAWALPQYIAVRENGSLSRSARIAASQLRSSDKQAGFHHLHGKNTLFPLKVKASFDFACSTSSTKATLAWPSRHDWPQTPCPLPLPTIFLSYPSLCEAEK